MAEPRRLVARPVSGQRTFYRLATFALAVGLLYWAQSILLPVALAVLFAFALTPVAEWLEGRGLPRGVSSVVVAVAALGLLGGVGYLASGQAVKLSAVVQQPENTRHLRDKVRPLLALLERIEAAEEIGPAATAPDGKPAQEEAKPQPVTIVKPKGTDALAYLPGLALPAVELLANALLVVVLTIFLLVQREGMRDRVLALAGRRQLTTTTRALDDAGRRVGKFLLLQAGTNAAMGVVAGVGLALIGVPGALLWGVLTACLRFIPYVGLWASALFPFTIGLAVDDGWGTALLVLAVYAGFDLVLTNVIEPMLFGHGTGVSSLALLVSAAFWAFLWGPVGLLLAVPMTVCLVVLGEHVPSLRFFRTALGDEPQVDPAARYFHRALTREYDEASLLVEEQARDRPLMAVYDEVILPALAQAKTERDRGELSSAEERGIYRMTRDILEGVLATPRAEERAGEKPSAGPRRAVACSTKGEADRIALTMLRDVALPAGCEVTVVPAAAFVDEVRKRAADGGAEVVAVVAAISPGGLAQAAGLCKRVRVQVPGAKLIVGRWGVTDDREGTRKFLTEAGAAKVTWTLRESLGEIAPEVSPPHGAAVPGPRTEADPGQVLVPA